MVFIFHSIFLTPTPRKPGLPRRPGRPAVPTPGRVWKREIEFQVTNMDHEVHKWKRDKIRFTIVKGPKPEAFGIKIHRDMTR